MPLLKSKTSKLLSHESFVKRPKRKISPDNFSITTTIIRNLNDKRCDRTRCSFEFVFQLRRGCTSDIKQDVQRYYPERKIHKVRRTPVKRHKQASLSRAIVTLESVQRRIEVAFTRASGKKEKGERGRPRERNAAIIVLFDVDDDGKENFRHAR